MAKENKQEIMEAVCHRISKGDLVKYAAKAEGITAETVRDWAHNDPALSLLYAHARQQQAHALAEQALEIADGSDALTRLYEEAIDAEEERLEANPNRGKIIKELRSNLLNRDRMRMDARKWFTSKIAPKLYGEKIEVSGPEGGPLTVKVTHEVIDPSGS